MTDQVETVAKLKRIIEDRLGRDRVSSTHVTPYLDHAGEPAYSIAVSMNTAEEIPEARRQSELTQELLKTLAEMSDPRFPYLYFDAPDIDRSADDEDDFEPLPKD